MSYRRLAQKDRYQIEAYLKSGLNQSEIARKLSVHRSTISRERRRLKKSYCGETADEKAKQLRALRNERRFKIKDEMKTLIESKLKNDWSPEQIFGRLKLEGQACASTQTIYRFLERDKQARSLYRGRLRLLRNTRNDHKREGWAPAKPHLGVRKNIIERPVEADRRERIGDYERDTVFGKLNGPFLLTIVDRTSRLTKIAWIERKNAVLIHEATVELLKGLTVRTITNDNGIEFSKHNLTSEVLNVPIYFSNAYRSWERGTNENTNGLIRQYFPKKTPLEKLTRAEVQAIEDRLNSRPRKCLGWKTPFEIHNAA